VKCTDCRFSLTCYAGRLDGDTRDGAVMICPTCERVLLYRKGQGYTFKCELHTLTRAVRRKWRETRKAAQSKMTVMQFFAETPGPPLTSFGILVRECPSCAPGSAGRYLNVSIPTIDLDEELESQKGLTPNPLGLRNKT